LRSLPGHDIHRCQSAGDGAVICFKTGSLERSLLLVKSLSLFPIRVSFGSVESSVSMPFSMSHASVPKELRSVNAVPQDLVRLSIGLEAANDLIADLSQAIRSVSVRRVPIAETRASSASVCC
jgi:cystathionine beta-lyase